MQMRTLSHYQLQSTPSNKYSNLVKPFEYLRTMLGDTFFEDMVTSTNNYAASKGYFYFINSFIHFMFIIIPFIIICFIYILCII